MSPGAELETTMGYELKSKPLIETIFELHWSLPDREGVPRNAPLIKDPSYAKILNGMTNALHADFPYQEALDSPPGFIIPYAARHRLRSKEGGWPLVQLGSGILTVNDTDGYKWESFLSMTEGVLKHLGEVHPAGVEIPVETFRLKYIDAVHLADQGRVLDFIETYLGSSISLPEEAFGEAVNPKGVKGLDAKVSFEAVKPQGIATIRYVTGKKRVKGEAGLAPALIWETTVESHGDQCPKSTDATEWMKDAHAVTDRFFWKMIAGKLEEEFQKDG